MRKDTRSGIVWMRGMEKMEVCRRIYSERLGGIDSEKRNILMMTRGLPGDLDLSWSIELDEPERSRLIRRIEPYYTITVCE